MVESSKPGPNMLYMYFSMYYPKKNKKIENKKKNDRMHEEVREKFGQPLLTKWVGCC